MKTINDFWKELKETQLKTQRKEREKRMTKFDVFLESIKHKNYETKNKHSRLN